MTVIETEFLPVAKPKKPLLAEKFLKPYWLLWTLVLPQAILLLINLNSWSIIKGDTTALQKEMALQIFAFEIALISAGCLISAILTFLKKNLNFIFCAALLIANIAYLWLTMAWIFKILPAGVTVWILPEEQVIFYQFIFIMPAIFYTGLRLACFKSPFGTAADVSLSIAAMILVPLCTYIAALILEKIFRSFIPPHIPELVIIIGFLSATAITLFAFTRVLTYLYILLNKYKVTHLILLLLIGLAAPIGGLILNRWTPFPTDFQSIGVYVMAVINGIILLLTFKQTGKLQLLCWFMRCVMFPFTLYFFLVFLPFLPLSLFAILACGAGFLILTPTALFLVHSRKILEEGKIITARLGLPAVIMLFVIGFAIIPAIITARTFSDKYSLAQAVNAVYNPDYAKQKIEINPRSVKNSLLKLRDMKTGIFLPFISTFYNNIVFNGMVLPDSKMNDMYMVFFGTAMPKNKSEPVFSIFNTRSRFDRAVSLPPRDVDISDIKVTQKQQGDFIKAEIELLLTNKGPSISEFATDIQLDQGVMISGYWLNIGSEKVAGKIFEKKAAMWVYHMIRDFTRRDPGILIYKNQTAAQLSVYPFEANQSRTTGIELLYPAGLNPSIIVGSKQVALYNDQLSPSQQIMLANNDESTVAFVPAPVLQQLPAVQRKPYIHFIVDKSLKARKSFDTFAKTMSDIAEKYSPTDQCKITFANYDSSDVNVFVAINEIENAVKSPASKSITFEGAFCYSNIIKQKLLEFKDKNASCDNLDVPVFVVIKAPDSNSVALGQMAPFGQITPDIQKYYIALKDGMFDAIGFDGKQTLVERIESADSSILFKYGSSYAICVKDSNFAIAKFPSTEKNVLEVYEPARNTFFEINDVKPLADDSTYEKGLALWNKYNESIYYPYKAETQLPEIVKMSKESGIMVPATSYMVVENSSQQEILKRKEKQSLNANQAYEFDEYMESPAPSILFIAPIALFLLHKIKRRHNLTSNLIK